MYTVTIEKRHCENTEYASCSDCALARAIREQLPRFKLAGVGGSYVRAKNDKKYFFNDSFLDGGWSSWAFQELMLGNVKSISVTFSRNPKKLNQGTEPSTERRNEVQSELQRADITKQLSQIEIVSETSDLKKELACK